MPPSAVLFDLDGTISDSGTTIMATLHETLVGLGHAGLDGRVARQVVGPPLGHTMEHLLGLDADQIAIAIPAYRALLSTRVHEIPPYGEVIDLLRDLATAGVPMAVATSKLTAAAELVVDAYGIRDLFVAVCGSPPDESVASKADVVADALAGLEGAGVDVEGAVMVGDRHHDIDGAAANGLAAIAVGWGYGDPSEWRDAAAVAETPADLRRLLLGDSLRDGGDSP